MANDLDEDLKRSIKELLKLYNIELEEGALDERTPPKPVDLAEVVSKTREKLGDLQAQMQKICERTGMTREEIEAYARNPNNFTKEQWEMLERVRNECEEFKEKAYSLFPQAKKPPSAPSQDNDGAGKKKKKGKQVQKKDWLAT